MHMANSAFRSAGAEPRFSLLLCKDQATLWLRNPAAEIARGLKPFLNNGLSIAQSFLKNQAKAVWSCDFFVQHTVGFRVLREFIGWYNHGRVHQELNGIPDPGPALADPKPLSGRIVAVPVLNGLHHDYRLAA